MHKSKHVFPKLNCICVSNIQCTFDSFCLQLSFIQHSLMSPEVFCFADYPCHTVAIDILKAPPEDDNREIATWYGPHSPAGQRASWLTVTF